MYARLVFITGDPARVGDGIRYVEGAAQPVAQELSGYRGMTLLVDRERGSALVATFWATPEDRDASEQASRAVRDSSVAAFGGTARVENYDLAVFEQRRLPAPGAGVRLTFTEGDPADADLAVDAFRTGVVPNAELLPGFCRALSLVDRPRGRGIGAVVYADQAALAAARTAAASIRAETTAKAHLSVRAVDEYELVLTTVQPD